LYKGYFIYEKNFFKKSVAFNKEPRDGALNYVEFLEIFTKTYGNSIKKYSEKQSN